jgi:hypothetical protein
MDPQFSTTALGGDQFTLRETAPGTRWIGGMSLSGPVWTLRRGECLLPL